MIPDILFNVHQRFVTSGPKEIPTPLRRNLSDKIMTDTAQQNRHVYWAHGQVLLGGLSKAATKRLERATSRSDGLPRLHSQLAQKQQDVGHTRTHQAFRTRLPTYSRNLSYVVQSDLILTKEAPMHNEISFEAIRRKDTFFFGRRFCGAEQRC